MRSLPPAALICLLGVVVAEAAAPSPADTSLAAARSLLEEIRGRDRRRGFEYQADTFVVYGQSGDSILLRGRPARVTHRGAELEAGEMLYRRRQEVVEARSVLDSSGNPTGEPVLKRGDETLRGSRILYDLKQERGTILDGRIARDKGYYAGRQIETASAEEIHVYRGSYTTCDYAEPHFDFYSPRIKVVMDEMAIARPVYVRVDRRRILWIPFYVFSLRRDRQSGILTPSFGRRPISYADPRSEWEIRNLGYYLAPSDYWDLTLAGDLRQRSGWLARARLAYALRYRWQGSIDAQLENRYTGTGGERAWRLDLRHNQQLDPVSQINASGTFQSNASFSRDNADRLSERLNRTLRSNVSYSRRWRASGNSLSATASQTKNLDTRVSDVVLPEISFRKARQPIWAGSSIGPGSGASPPWYGRVYYDASARLRNGERSSPYDTTEQTSGTATVRLSSQHKPASWLQISPTLTETWTDADLRSGDDRSLRSDRFATSATLTQTYYGLFHPPLPGVAALRHVLKPSASLNYQAARADTGGVLGAGGAAGSWDQRRRLDLRLDNTFWAKVQRGEEESKVRLAQLVLATTYDFENEDRPLSDLTTSLSVAAGRALDSRLTMRSGLYDDAGELHLLAPRLQQFEVRTTARLRQRADAADGPVDVAGSTSTGMPSGLESPFGYESGLRGDVDSRQRQLEIAHYYSRTRLTAGSLTRSWVRTSIGVSLGRADYHRYSRPRWHVDYSVNYDLHAPGQPLLATDRIVTELLSVRRDFHDWTATLNVEPSRFHRDRAFYFKAQLRDIPQLKLERGDSRL